MKRRFTTDYIAKVAILSALSIAIYTFTRFPIFPPPYNVLDLDFSALPSLIGGFALGPLAGVLIEVIKVLTKIAMQGLSFGGVGDLSNLIISLSFVLPATIIYSKNRTLKGAIIGLSVSVVSQIIIGAISNYFIIIPLVASIPGLNFYMDIRFKFVLWASLFNLIKGTSNALLAMVLYKRLSPILKNQIKLNSKEK